MAKVGKRKRLNIYFRQTAEAFKASKQTQIFSHINSNLPYRLYRFSRELFSKNLRKLNLQFSKIRSKLPNKAKRIR